MTPTQTTVTSPETDRPAPKFKEQAVLTVKVLLVAGGTLGLLALLEWIAVK
jgi:hypothetical protein